MPGFITISLNGHFMVANHPVWSEKKYLNMNLFNHMAAEEMVFASIPGLGIEKCAKDYWPDRVASIS